MTELGDIKKIGYTMIVPTALLDAAGPNLFELLMRPDTRTQAQKDADRREQDAKRAARRAEVDAIHAAALAAVNPALVPILRLHEPVWRYNNDAVCEGCDLAGYEVESPDWPCTTYRLAAGIPE